MRTERKCSNCGAVEGHKRPIGGYTVELHELEFMGEMLDLCITCYKHHQKKVNRHTEVDERIEKHSFFSNFKNSTKKLFI